MPGFARSRMIEGGVQVEMDTDTAQTLHSLLGDGAAASYGDEGLERLLKALSHTLVIDRPDYSKPIVDEEYCDRCDGCGWYEGGKTLKTTCEKCGGTGVVKKK